MRAIRALRNNGDHVCIVPQNLYEFWSVATRPAHSEQGLALTPQQADRVTTRLEQLLVSMRDTPAVYDEWRRLVAVHSTSGKASHDARLVAATIVHGIDHVLTFNVDDFKRYPGIEILLASEVQRDEPQMSLCAVNGAKVCTLLGVLLFKGTARRRRPWPRWCA